MTGGAGPFTGVRVLDLCHFLAGPYATLALADLGADVIKIEDPLHPDEARAMGPHFREGESLYFLSLNWAKRSFGVRLKDERGRKVFFDLVATADVVVDNFRPGVMARLGLSHEALTKVNPRIVTCSLTGFGETGAYAPRAGYDYTIQALSGVMGLTGDPDRPPGKAGISYVDHAGGLTAALSVSAALLERTRTGVGRHLDVALMDVQMSMLSYLATWQLNAGFAPERTPGGAHPSLVPAQTFASADGHISIFVGNDAMWLRLVTAVGEPGLADERFVANAGRKEHREEVLGLLGACFEAEPSASWAERLAAHGVPCAPVNGLADALADPHVTSRGLVATSEHPAYGRYEHTRGPIPLASVEDDRGAPLLGEHSGELLRELGYRDAEIEGLVREGVITRPETRVSPR